jgi:hypothetical protein
MFSLITSGTVRHAVRTQRIIPARERESPVPAPSFWGSIAAGTMVVLGICALSDLLMLSGPVGVYRDGAAVWMMITACVAYYGGGLVASRLSLNGTWLQGVVLWGLSIPLSLLVVAGVAEAAGIASGQSTEMTAQMINGSGTAGAWAVFISVALGLAFAVLGSTAGACACNPVRIPPKHPSPD